jgi:hypothetical protein
MPNVFIVEWVENDPKGGERSVRQNVEFGNFDGGVEEAQHELDKLWPFSSPHRRNVKVIDVFGSGQVRPVTIPADNPSRGKVTKLDR